MKNIKKRGIPDDVTVIPPEKMTRIPLDRIEKVLADVSMLDKDALMEVFNLTFGEGAYDSEPENDSDFVPEKPVEIPKPSLSSDMPNDVKAILKQCENCGCYGNGICGMYNCKIEYAKLLCLKNDIEEKEKENEFIRNQEK